MAAYTKKWTTKDIEFLRKNYGRMTKAQLCQHFGCSKHSLTGVINRYGILPDQFGKHKVETKARKDLQWIEIPEIRAKVGVKPGKDPAVIRDKYLNRHIYNKQ